MAHPADSRDRRVLVTPSPALLVGALSSPGDTSAPRDLGPTPGIIGKQRTPHAAAGKSSGSVPCARQMADAMERHGIRGSVSLNVAVCDHFPAIVERCVSLGCELVSHGVYNTRYLYDMGAAQLRAVITDCRETIARVSSQRMDGWLSPALSNDDQVQHVLGLYTLDMVHDDQRMPVRTRSGQLVSMPYSLDVNDVPLLLLQGRSPDEYTEIAIAQFE